MSRRAIMALLFVVGVGFLFPFTYTITLTLGVGFLAAFVVYGLFTVANPEFLARDEEPPPGD